MAENKKIDLSQFPGAYVEEVIVPVPSEVFAVLDKLGQPNWRAELRTQTNQLLTARHELALQFGVVVADGFIAVQAQDKTSIKELGSEVRRLATALAVDKEVSQHAQSILDNADRNDFEAVRQEFDRVQNTVRDKLRTMRDDDVAQCVSIGGWLRGTQVVTSLVSQAYDKDKAELLNQPDLVSHFRDLLKVMDPEVRRSPKLRAVGDGLEKIHAAMEPSAGGMISPTAIETINQECTVLVDAITGPASTGTPSTETP
ncbi:hypothetical protein BH23VER1_BH23VER1_12240 [soil metagenome]